MQHPTMSLSLVNLFYESLTLLKNTPIITTESTLQDLTRIKRGKFA
jgi:hypothetical protein